MLEKITCSAFLVRSGLNDIFHWYAQSCIFNRSVTSVEVEVFTQFKMQNKESSSGKSLISEFSPTCRLFIKMRKNRGLNADPCSTPSLIDCQLKNRPSKRQFDVYYGGMTLSIEEHFRLFNCF